MAELSIVFRTKLENLGAESGLINTTRGYPVSLRVLVDMILRGSNINREPAERDPNQACLTIAQLIVFNSNLREHGTASRYRHTRAKECPVPIYTSLKIHGMTRDKSLIDAFCQLGLFISYDSLLSVSSDIANHSNFASPTPDKPK